MKNKLLIFCSLGNLVLYVLTFFWSEFILFFKDINWGVVYFVFIFFLIVKMIIIEDSLSHRLKKLEKKKK